MFAPKSESPVKIYGSRVERFASVKRIPVFPVPTPKLKAAIVIVDGPVLLRSTSNPIADEPASTVTDWVDRMRLARACGRTRKLANAARSSLLRFGHFRLS